MHTINAPEPPDAHAYGHIKKLFLRIIARREAARRVNPYEEGARAVIAADAEAELQEQRRLDELLNPELRYPHLAPFIQPTRGS